MLKTKVKVGKVTNLSEARYCAGMGVDLLSFPISSVDPKLYKEITAWVAGPQFGIAADSEDLLLTEEYAVNFIEVTPDQFNYFADGENFIVTLTKNEWPDQKQKLVRLKEKILYIELDAGQIDGSALEVIHEVAKDFNLLLKIAGNFNLEILKLPIAGISLDGNTETKPGLKEYPLAEILEMLDGEAGG